MPQTREHEFAQLYEEYLDTLVRFAFSIVHDQEDAEDIVAGVFVALWQSGKEWDRAGIRPYLFASVRNRGYTYLRAEKRASAVVNKMVETSDELIYVGHTGGGFTQKELARLYKLLKPLERGRSPFAIPPRTNARPHWVEPQIVVEVKFSEWTADGRLRQPIYLGTRDDKKARDVGHAA